MLGQLPAWKRQRYYRIDRVVNNFTVHWHGVLALPITMGYLFSQMNEYSFPKNKKQLKGIA
ncbi:hypothetical protein [Pseudomonas sp. FME51]|uniref:hypothetical protein n=1 Tax=Pseudomonas sp. FME51 TaxID=2742609 RepID=UPI001865A4FF|nr:hypothetical protein [Pseudomonas sp. FME51]